MDPWFSLVFFLSIALVFSFLCSVLEAVILSVTPAFIASRSGALAERLQEMKRDIDRPLAAILSVNTFAHTIGAAGVGAAAQEIWGEGSLALVSGAVTFLILIGSEIIPKTIGAIYWQQLVGIVVRVTRILTLVLSPLVAVCQQITRLLRHGETGSILSRSDVSQIAKFGYRDGSVHEHERDIIDNLMRKESLETGTVMTGIQRLVALEASQPLSVVSPASPTWHISRIPIYDDHVDNIVGYVLKDDVLAQLLARNGARPLNELKRPMVSVDSGETLIALYRGLIKAHEHIAIVKQEGRTVGVVTMEDVIEELLGQEIVDESDRARGVVD
jgi:CBS domain containing-hemolysin-like protein